MNNQLKIGIKVEGEHKGTIRFIENYYRKHNKYPTSYTIQEHIAREHLKENPMYYTKLRRMKL